MVIFDSTNAVTGTTNNTAANLVYENAQLRRRVKRLKRRRVQQEQRLETLEEQVSILEQQLAREIATRACDAAEHQKQNQLLSKGMRELKRELKRERFERIRLETRSRNTTRDGMQDSPALSRRRGIAERPAQGRMTALDSSANEGPTFFMVQDCGTAAVNGTFYQDGYFDGACKYVKEGTWNDQMVTFCIFQCTVSNQTRHWYISIFPDEDSPGTSADIDFYTSPVTQECIMVPPVSNWELSQEGLAPPPRVSHTEMHPW